MYTFFFSILRFLPVPSFQNAAWIYIHRLLLYVLGGVKINGGEVVVRPNKESELPEKIFKSEALIRNIFQ